MMFEKYKTFIEQHISFNPVEWALLKSKLKVSHHEKGSIIHHAGYVCNQLSFINEGIARAYLIDENGKDYTWGLFFNDINAAMTNVYSVDYDSFVNQRKSVMYIEAIEDCQLLSLTYDDVKFLYSYSKKGERFGRLMAELAYSYTHQQFVSRITQTASEKLENFMLNTPYLLEKVPQYHIATFLGITPQSLSRLKKDLNY